MASINPIQAADPASKTAYTFTDVGALHNAIKIYNYIPLRPDGSPFKTQYLQEYDGYVLDGAPINVWMLGYWLEGQKAAMEPYWNSGQIPRPVANILNTNVQPMPAAVAAQTAAYQESQKAAAPGLFGMDTGTLLAIGAGLAAIFWISRQ